jgi:hypothetical protein
MDDPYAPIGSNQLVQMLEAWPGRRVLRRDPVLAGRGQDPRSLRRLHLTPTRKANLHPVPQLFVPIITLALFVGKVQWRCDMILKEIAHCFGLRSYGTVG